MKRNISGQRIRAARAMYHPPLKQDDLVALLHTKYQIILTKNTLSRIETGNRYVTDQELVAFAKALHVSTAWLLNETSDPTPNTGTRR